MKLRVIKTVTQAQFKTSVTAFITLDFMKRTFLKLLLKSNKTGFDSNKSLTWKQLLILCETITYFILTLGDAKESIKGASQTLSGGYPSSPTPMSPGPGSRHQLRRESAINLEDGLNDETGGQFTFERIYATYNCNL